MGKRFESSRTVACAALVLLLTGCASSTTPKPSGLGAYGSLYDGKSQVVYGTQFPVSSAAEAIQRGDIAVTSGDLDRALFEYIRALDLDDDNADALYKIGVIHSARGNQQLAEVAFRWALRGQPNQVRALTGLGVLLLKRREYEESKKHLEKAVSIEPRIPSAHSALGVIADLEGAYPRAQSHYSKALEGNPKSPSLLNNLGYSRYLSGDWKGATAAFREALIADPQYDLAWRNLGLVYARQQEYTKALDALSKTEDVPKAYNDMGYVAMVSGRLGDAESFFEKAMHLSPDYYELAETNGRRIQLMRGLAGAP
ncbi:MAG: tetratricopeptide repeat protein [Pseudomonadota bacterium]|nr:tetratricopeptide repeat protein [Pseudomonadota bacterium]